MSSNKKKIVLGSTLVLLGLAGVGTGVYLYTNNAQKQDVKPLTVNQPPETGTNSSGSEDSDNLSTDTSTVEEPTENVTPDMPQLQGSIKQNYRRIYQLTKSFNDFNVADNATYDNIVNQLRELNVTVDDASVKGPFGMYDPQEAVISGVIMSDSAELNEDGSYTFTFNVRTGRSAMIDDVDYTASEIRGVLTSDDYVGAETPVVYQLDISEDGNSATLRRTSTTNWW